jgi:predicted lipoprotein with Yx(FWY)xxD motif
LARIGCNAPLVTNTHAGDHVIHRHRTAFAAIVAGLITLLAAPAAMSLTDTSPKPPAVKVQNRSFGDILQSKNKLPLYYWSTEKRAGGKIRCTGECARVWPPLVVKSRAAVPPTMRGVKGRFGVVKRPDGRLQVTFRGLPLYAYHGDPPNTVLCDNVDGWFVVRV